MADIKDKKEENKDWLELCQYVHKEILQYDSDLKFPRHLALRLRGLHSGQFMANKNAKPMASYDYKVILYTFKISKSSIMQCFIANKTKFANENHKINTLMVIIESNINDVVVRLKNAKSAKTKAENIDMGNIFHEGAEYKAKTKEVNDTLKDLW